MSRHWQSLKQQSFEEGLNPQDVLKKLRGSNPALASKLEKINWDLIIDHCAEQSLIRTGEKLGLEFHKGVRAFKRAADLYTAPESHSVIGSLHGEGYAVALMKNEGGKLSILESGSVPQSVKDELQFAYRQETAGSAMRIATGADKVERREHEGGAVVLKVKVAS